jgi:hypothetical protein
VRGREGEASPSFSLFSLQKNREDNTVMSDPRDPHAPEASQLHEPRVVEQTFSAGREQKEGKTCHNPRPNAVNTKPPMPQIKGGDHKADSRPSVPAPAVEHGHQPVPGLKNIRRTNPAYGNRRK